ncbi:hypothetical protein DFP72DRAFT_922875 [Ephemerocybe angulata]|uniref:Uncharacterized protein n=1 Tax=Ephemerocybe angulata TaxID=980116 RepID=A0A8H6LVX7_9AGAR|nr:hypothetical protein DFP72DRAFT_928846 [Tulosesus angulatus]KAF6744635.1 hypothetical protein DFP72DRAFT_927906 [Tulosesus angulatus]KAF6746526.1 hypothetical protein DFP72DRAFT_922875 [Tulosesus angulatus]
MPSAPISFQYPLLSESYIVLDLRLTLIHLKPSLRLLFHHHPFHTLHAIMPSLESQHMPSPETQHPSSPHAPTPSPPASSTNAPYSPPSSHSSMPSLISISPGDSHSPPSRCSSTSPHSTHARTPSQTSTPNPARFARQLVDETHRPIQCGHDLLRSPYDNLPTLRSGTMLPWSVSPPRLPSHLHLSEWLPRSEQANGHPPPPDSSPSAQEPRSVWTLRLPNDGLLEICYIPPPPSSPHS